MPLLTPQARAHRADLAELVGVAQRDLGILFRQFGSADAARDGLMDLLPRLTATYGVAAASLAVDFYDDLRDASDARGRFRAIPAESAPRGQTDALARWSVAPLFRAEPDFDLALIKVGGGVQRLIVNADRETVRASSIQDRGARGWARAGAGKCNFCADLIGRGAVYTEATASFQSHDHCGCVAVPEF